MMSRFPFRLSLVAVLAVAFAHAQTTEQPVRQVTDPGVVTTRQHITPAGVQSIFEGRVYGVDFAGKNEEIWVLNAGQVLRMDWKANQVLDRISIEGSPGLQGLRYSAATSSIWISGAARGSRESPGARSRLMTIRDGKLAEVAANLGTVNAGALAIAPKPNAQGRHIAVIPLIKDNKLAVVDIKTGQTLGHVPTGIAPFAAVVNETGTIAYVSNWGGALPEKYDKTAPAGLAPDADRVVIDDRGVAAIGAVTKINLETMKAEYGILTGLHPTGLAWDLEQNRLYVANSNGDSITVVNTQTDRPARTFRIQPFVKEVAGIAPNALALAPDGAVLYVACGGINAVAIIDTNSGTIKGMIPTAWYPTAIALSPDATQLAVSTLLGPGSGWQGEPRKRFVHSNRGSVHVIAVPDAPTLRAYTVAVAENTRLALAGTVSAVNRPRRSSIRRAIPENFGDPSLIEHVVYIVKENRTYDQVFGAMTKGNGDPSLVMFGEDVTPNHHRLADQFVLLDNFYATGGNSGDGHQWVTQANETAYAMWPGYQGRSYPYDGTDPIAYSSSGFIWDSAVKRGKTVKVYGEYIPRMSGLPASERHGLLERWKKGEDFSKTWTVKSDIPTLQKLLAPNFPSYSTAIPDQIRADLFLKELKEFEANGQFPNLTLIQLPSDHTYGASPDVSTPKAMVADNDLALGRIVEALSKSPFWKKMAIFVVEDDAQNGVDHVDGHRTVALAISPYIRRGSVDSTFYSQPSMLKTIELILGLEPLSLFDLIANDMRPGFHDTPDFTPYSAVEPKQDLFERNPGLKTLRGNERRAAADSSRMRWDVPDAVPTERLNRILWHSIRGWNTPYPAPRQAVFSPVSLDVDDDDREKR